jgi:hypothetical protein
MEQPQRQNHRIGENSSFDVDMDLIEMFVKCKQNPDNIVAQTAVVTYYISQAYNYWDKLTEFLDDEDNWPQGEDTENVYTDDEPCGPVISQSLSERKNARWQMYNVRLEK